MVITKRKRTGSFQNTEAEEEHETDCMIRRIKNKVFFHCAVSRETILTLIEKLSEAETEALQMCESRDSAKILLYIHSEGGDAYAGFSGMNHIQTSRVPIITVADGFVASAATFLLLAGHKRYGMQHSSVLIHQVSTGFWGKYAELVDEMKNSTQIMGLVRSIYKTTTRMRKKELSQLLEKELTMTANQCLLNGIIHALVPTSGVLAL